MRDKNGREGRCDAVRFFCGRLCDDEADECIAVFACSIVGLRTIELSDGGEVFSFGLLFTIVSISFVHKAQKSRIYAK